MNDSLIATGLPLATGHRCTANTRTLVVNPIRWLASWISPGLAMLLGAAELRAMDNRRLADIGLTRELVEYLTRYGTLPRNWGHPHSDK